MNKAIVPLIVALAVGLGAALTARNLLSKKNPAPIAAAPGTQMVVSKRAILPGQAITLDDLTVTQIEGGKAPSGTFNSRDALVGRVALLEIGENQPILQNMLADASAGTGLQALLPDGMRAITIDVNEVSGVGGLLVPGCHVDLLTSLHAGSADSLVTRTLVQDIKVIAVGQSLSPPNPTDGQVARSVTLIVTPQQAETVELASNVGRPRLVLRSGADNNILKTDGVSLAQLQGGQLPVATASTSAPHSVEIIRGGVESIVTFSNGISSPQSVLAPHVAGGGVETAPVAPH